MFCKLIYNFETMYEGFLQLDWNYTAKNLDTLVKNYITIHLKVYNMKKNFNKFKIKTKKVIIEKSLYSSLEEFFESP